MLITEYFAKLLAVDLAPDGKDLYTYWDVSNNVWYFRNEYYVHTQTMLKKYQDIKLDSNNEIQLRKDGINLYRLEWRKPTEQDIMFKCWMLKQDGLVESYHVDKYTYLVCQKGSKKILVADHGQIAPKLEDFERVYNAN